MKAYLHLEDNPYNQNQTTGRQEYLSVIDPASCDNGDPDNDVYTEADLLPRNIPSEYRELLPENMLFHAHRFMEITRVLKGRALYIVDKKICYLHPGEIIIFNSFVPHAWFFLDEDMEITDYSFSNVLLNEPSGSVPLPLLPEPSTQKLCLNIWHTKPTGDKIPLITSSNGFVMKEDFLMTLINSSFRFAHIKIDTPMHDIFTGLLNDIDTESREKRFAYEYIIHSKLMEFVAQLFRLHSDNSHLTSTQKKPEMLMSALEYMYENLHQDLHLETVAKHCFLTPQYFSAYFKKYTGLNFSKYLSELRLERALNELIQTDKSILEIAFQCGFNSKTSFYRAWYSKHQISPSQIRKTYQKGD